MHLDEFINAANLSKCFIFSNRKKCDSQFRTLSCEMVCLKNSIHKYFNWTFDQLIWLTFPWVR